MILQNCIWSYRLEMWKSLPIIDLQTYLFEVWSQTWHLKISGFWDTRFLPDKTFSAETFPDKTFPDETFPAKTLSGNRPSRPWCSLLMCRKKTELLMHFKSQALHWNISREKVLSLNEITNVKFRNAIFVTKFWQKQLSSN